MSHVISYEILPTTTQHCLHVLFVCADVGNKSNEFDQSILDIGSHFISLVSICCLSHLRILLEVSNSNFDDFRNVHTDLLPRLIEESG